MNKYQKLLWVIVIIQHTNSMTSQKDPKYRIERPAFTARQTSSAEKNNEYELDDLDFIGYESNDIFQTDTPIKKQTDSWQTLHLLVDQLKAHWNLPVYTAERKEEEEEETKSVEEHDSLDDFTHINNLQAQLQQLYEQSNDITAYYDNVETSEHELKKNTQQQKFRVLSSCTQLPQRLYMQNPDNTSEWIKIEDPEKIVPNDNYTDRIYPQYWYMKNPNHPLPIYNYYEHVNSQILHMENPNNPSKMIVLIDLDGITPEQAADNKILQEKREKKERDEYFAARTREKLFHEKEQDQHQWEHNRFCCIVDRYIQYVCCIILFLAKD